MCGIAGDIRFDMRIADASVGAKQNRAFARSVSVLPERRRLPGAFGRLPTR